MTVIHIKKTENFVILHKGALENPSLSFKAKGLWAYCMSKPDNWTFHVKHLATVSKEGEDAIYSIIKELTDAGYVERVQKNENGRFGATDYIFHEISQLKLCLPHRAFPDTENPLPVNPALISTDSLLSIEKKEEGGPAEPLPAPPQKRKKIQEEKVEVAPRVWLTPSQQESLNKKLNTMGITPEQCYQKLSSWYIGKESPGGKSDYLTILNWVINAVQGETKIAPKTPFKGATADSWEIEGHNRAWMTAKRTEHNELVRTGVLREGADYVEFFLKCGTRLKVYLRDKAFINIVECQVRKMISPPSLSSRQSDRQSG